jgi:ribonuclease HII
MTADLWAFEKSLAGQGYAKIAGVDEAGRGPLAGPVVSAAVVLPADFRDRGVTDSKKLSPGRREKLFSHIYDQAEAIGIGIVDAQEIDRINILQAARLSMVLALAHLGPSPDYVLVDGNFRLETDLPHEPVIKGDARSISIAAASIVAKVTRDRLMLRYHDDFPQYGFDRHKGYPTKSHKTAIAVHGPCRIHRRSFRGVLEHLDSQSPSDTRKEPAAHVRS